MNPFSGFLQNCFQSFTGSPSRNRERIILYRYPVLLVAGLLLAGFVLGEYSVLTLEYRLLMACAALLASTLFFRNQKIFPLAFAVFWFATGSFLFTLVYQVPLDRLVSLSGSAITVEGYLESDGSRLFLREIRGFPGYAPALLVRESRTFRIDKTETNVRITGRYRFINSCANPGVTDLFDFWWKRRVFGEISVETIVYLGERSFLRSAMLGLRQARERFFAGWEQDLGEAYPLFAALVWGERGEAFYRHSDVLRRSGIYHAFCVSGLHMALFGSLVLFLFQVYAPIKKWSWLPAMVFSFGYLAFCGFSPSAFRAWLMFALFLTGQRLGRNAAGINVLALAFLFMFLLQPETVFLPGAQLSYAATAGILLVSGMAGRFSSQRGWFLRYLKGTTIVTLGVFAASLPILIVHGFTFSSLAFLGNLLLMPMIQVTIGLTFLGTLVGVSQGLRMLVIPLIRTLLSVILTLANWFVEHMPHLFWDFTARARRWDGALLWMVVCAVLLMLSFARRREQQVIVLVTLAVSVVLLLGFQPQPLFEFWVLDVGQGLGTSAIIGDRALVFDNGGIIRNYGNIGSSVFSPFLHYQGVEIIEAVFITHPHLDHQGGTAPLVTEFPVDMVYYRKNGAPLEADNVLPIQDPARFMFKDLILVEVFPVDGPKVNDQALVFRVHLPGLSILISGDIEEEGMRQLFRYGGHNLTSEVLIMPHHGQYTSTLRELLLLSDCSFAIISVGENRYGHPDPRTLDLLDELGVTTLVTGRDGGIRIAPGNNGWRVESFGKSAIFALD